MSLISQIDLCGGGHIRFWQSNKSLVPQKNRNNGKRDMIYRKGLQFGRGLDKEVRGVYQKKKIQSEAVG